jgi:hypothetical protein
MNSKEILLQLFRDNNTKYITAASIRKFVEAVYSEMLLTKNVIDSVDTYESDKVASLNQTSKLQDAIETLKTEIQEIQDNFSIKHSVYTKDETDLFFYNKQQINSEIYKKSETFSRNETANLYYDKTAIDQKFDEIQRRIDNIIAKNNLSE